MDEQQTTINRQNIIIKMTKVLIGTDVIVIILRLLGYCLIGEHASPYEWLYFLHFIYLYIVILLRTKTAFWRVFFGGITPFFLTPIVFIGWLGLAWVLGEEKIMISSPSGDQQLLIRHSSWSLGETHHNYNFYEQTFIPLVQKKLNHQNIKIVTRSAEGDDLQILGARNADSSQPNTVIFPNPYGEKIRVSLQ
ncbi:hypothetical protein [Priestia endophytica]|uniref:hypothetical protein n=1 Tax=Priestia endophytica TaxID=135735 RepID=UPI00124F5E21|nr:hypothetical protein [Priestia endophytica]KAB2495187.1 hypothetical protein F8155_04075 [Priestia endophytica]